MLIPYEGRLDRILRITVGLAVLSLTFIGPKSPWGLIGLLPLMTGLCGRCPAYTLFGIGTCPMPKGPSQDAKIPPQDAPPPGEGA